MRAVQRGTAALQLALVMPVVLLLITAVVQVASWQHAVHIAQAAAARGVENARVRGGTDASGAAAANQVVGQFSALHGTRVVVTRSATSVHAEVAAAIPATLPGLSLSVHAAADGPIEAVP